MTTVADPGLTKTCNACGQEFPARIFHRRAGGRELASECRFCGNRRRRRDRQRKRDMAVDGVVAALARTRPTGIERTFRIALQRLGGTAALANGLAEAFVETREHGTQRERFRMMFAMLNLFLREYQVQRTGANALDAPESEHEPAAAMEFGSANIVALLAGTLADENLYTGFFVNRCGERWILAIDRETHDALLAGDETAWEVIEMPGGELPAELLLAPEERAWLEACFAVVS